VTGTITFRQKRDGELEAEAEIEGLEEDSLYSVRLSELPLSKGFCPVSNSYLEDPVVFMQANMVGETSLSGALESFSLFGEDNVIGKAFVIGQTGESFLLADGEVLACCNITSVAMVEPTDDSLSSSESSDDALFSSDSSESEEESEIEDYLVELAREERQAAKEACSDSESDDN
jgi:hypothetical protein